MNKGIEIELQIREGQKYILTLTPQNYKKEYKRFLQQQGINASQAFYIKNIIQSKIISLYKGYEDKKPSVKLLEKQEDLLPKFGSFQQKQTQTHHENSHDGELHYFKTTKKASQSQSLFSTNFPQTYLPANHLKEEQAMRENKQEDELSQAYFNNAYQQQSEPNIPTVQKVSKKANKDNTVSKNKAYLEHSPSQQFDRLYQNPTESFKNKHNKDLNHKQRNDFLEVQKYLMNQRLKRTTNNFFQQLHRKATASSKAKKYSPQIQSKQIPFQSPPKKPASPTKSFKGLFKLSGCRCEKRIIEAQQLERRSKSKQRQDFIRKRMIKQRLYKKPSQQNSHKSRSCQKCNPREPTKASPKRKAMPEPKKQAPRPYISNILAQSYKEFTKQFFQ